MGAKVYLFKDNEAAYPVEHPYGPDTMYPEYPFSSDTLCKSGNKAYEMVRNCMRMMNLDAEKIGTVSWNPLGKWIMPGQTIVIKPNWVDDHNSCKKHFRNAMDCLVTHPSFVRAICDYCLIALKGEGKVIICDAPIQDCDLDKLWAKTGYTAVMDFYKEHGVPVFLKDLRSFRRMTNRWAVKTCEKHLGGEGVLVQMDEHTAFVDLKGTPRYSVPNYTLEKTADAHKNGEHNYSIAKDVLEADVIINFPKPKCHRYAGFTAALKNAVGMICEKSTLPHRRIGEVQAGGDSYSKKSAIKKAIDNVLLQQSRLEDAGHPNLATVYRFVYGGLVYLSRAIGEDASLKGCWHGNDTIWRTILDINYLLRYADKTGIVQSVPQRKIINFADMVVAGQHNGPLSPEPHPLGILVFSEDAASMDMTICKLMGFDSSKMPLCKNIINRNTWIHYTDPLLLSNYAKSQQLSTVSFPKEWMFEPHDAWKEALE